jgi:acylglycerol lipase
VNIHIKDTATQATFKGKGDFTIAYRLWPAVGAARGIVLIVPGFNSHSGYYEWVGTKFAAAGLAAYAVDLRGRGDSDGERYFVDSFWDYVSDLEGLAAVAKRDHANMPVYVLGHSAGGVVACLYALEHQAQLAGLICESFAHQLPAPDFVLAALKGLSHIAPHAHVLRLSNKDFSRDPAVVERMNSDPLIAHETQPTKTVAEMVRSDERLKREFPLITLPVLILHGTKDKATKPSGSQFFHETVGSKDKTLKLYEGYFHDLLNDVGREQVLEDVVHWIDARLT